MKRVSCASERLAVIGVVHRLCVHRNSGSFNPSARMVDAQLNRSAPLLKKALALLGSKIVANAL
jgi:hypothetical protein